MAHARTKKNHAYQAGEPPLPQQSPEHRAVQLGSRFHCSHDHSFGKGKVACKSCRNGTERVSDSRLTRSSGQRSGEVYPIPDVVHVIGSHVYLLYSMHGVIYTCVTLYKAKDKILH